MERFHKLMISAGVLTQLPAYAETEEDKKIKELRRQTSITRSVKRSTIQVKKNIEDIRNRMLLSGVY